MPASPIDNPQISDSDGRYRWGQLLNFGSAWAFYLATVFLHLGSAQNDLPPMFYAFIRYVIGFAIFGGWFFLEGKRFTRDASAVRFLILRGVFNLLALICFYQSVADGTTGKANVLNMTYPAFVALLAGPMLAEKPDRRTVVLVVLAVVGMLLNVFDPARGLHMPSLADLWGIASGITAGFAIVSLRGAARVSSPVEILCWMFGIGTIALLPFNLGELSRLFTEGVPVRATPTNAATVLSSAEAIGYVVASAVCGILGQWLLSVSYRYLDASAGSVISASRIPIALLAGVLFLNEDLVLLPWIGAGLILLSNILLAVQKPPTIPQND